MSFNSISHDALARIGFNSFFQTALSDAEPGLQPARITERHRNGWRCHDGVQEFPVNAAPGLLRQWQAQGLEPVVGDWCLLNAEPDGSRWMAQLLARRNAIVRRQEDTVQTLVANVDTALLLMGLDGNYNPRRLERYLLVARAAEAAPVVVLSKADACDNIDERLHEVQRLAGASCPVLAGDTRNAEMRTALLPWLQPGQTLVLLGSSGVGKSTLSNTLLGAAAQATGQVSEAQDRGRHTTVSRRLLPLADGACLIDTPGLRDLQLSGREQLGEGAFAQIAELAAQCRYADCGHANEPGCAVRDAVPAEQLAHFHKLGQELALVQRNPQQQRAQKQKDKAQTRALRRFYRDGD